MLPRNQGVQVLRGVELFQGLPPLIVKEVARRATHLTYRSGEILVRAGDAIDGAILIQEGQVISVSSSGNISGDLLPPGSLINEMGMLVEIDSDATIIARTDVTALGLTRQVIMSLVDAEPRLAEHFNQKISARVALLVGVKFTLGHYKRNKRNRNNRNGCFRRVQIWSLLVF